MKQLIQIRHANRSELNWINKCYDEADFVHSNFDKEVIAIAKYKEQKAGIGRLVRINEHALELGGMYVLEAFRNMGIAKEIIKFLLNQVKPEQRVYCIPFKHLSSFYMQYGFDMCQNLAAVPKEISEKYLWCTKKYSNPTLLLELIPAKSP